MPGGSLLACLGFHCLPCHIFALLLILHQCIGAFLETWFLQPLLPNCISAASFLYFCLPNCCSPQVRGYPCKVCCIAFAVTLKPPCIYLSVAHIALIAKGASPKFFRDWLHGGMLLLSPLAAVDDVCYNADIIGVTSTQSEYLQ